MNARYVVKSEKQPTTKRSRWEGGGDAPKPCSSDGTTIQRTKNERQKMYTSHGTNTCIRCRLLMHTSSGKIASHAQRCMERMVSPDGSALASCTRSDATPVSSRLLLFLPARVPAAAAAASASPVDPSSLRFLLSAAAWRERGQRERERGGGGV